MSWFKSFKHLLLLLGIDLLSRPKTRSAKLFFWFTTILISSFSSYRLFFLSMTCELSKARFYTITFVLFYVLVFAIEIWQLTKGQFAVGLIKKNAQTLADSSSKAGKRKPGKICIPVFLSHLYHVSANR